MINKKLKNLKFSYILYYNIYYRMKNEYFENYTSLTIDEIQKIKQNYKIININYFNTDVIKFKIITDEYFEKNPNKTKMVNNMINFYIKSKNIEKYKKTNYLCNENEKICICNIYADNFKRIYDGSNYDKNTKYVSWIKKNEENNF